MVSTGGEVRGEGEGGRTNGQTEERKRDNKFVTDLFTFDNGRPGQ